jgi:hypothetical protein
LNYGTIAGKFPECGDMPTSAEHSRLAEKPEPSNTAPPSSRGVVTPRCLV